MTWEVLLAAAGLVPLLLVLRAGRSKPTSGMGDRAALRKHKLDAKGAAKRGRKEYPGLCGDE